jgi:phosphomannomutase
MQPHLPDPSLFRAYDVRGIVGDNLHVEDFLAIGHAFASHIAEDAQCRTPLIVVVHDVRISSPELANAMIEGLMRAGAHVLDAGMGPTPMGYFAAQHLDADAAVIITGSHNPPSHNGAKFVVEGKSFYGAELAALRERLAEGRLLESRGQREEVHVHDEYLTAVKKALGNSDALNKISVAWDAGNGAAGVIIEPLLKATSVPQIGLCLEPDGIFPNHHPDPAEPENLHEVQRAVAEHQCAFGVAFDGDGDRLGVVDDQGRLVSPDHLLMLFAFDVLTRHAGATILADVKTSDIFFEQVKKHGGNPVMWKTGHAHMKTKMPEMKAIFAGEASGHLFFADEYFGYDDGIYAALRLARIVAEADVTLSALVDALPQLHTSQELRIPCDDNKKFDVIAAVAQELTQSGAVVNMLDGVRVSTNDGWWLLRASNTQAALVARAEGTTPENTRRLLATLQYLLNAQGVHIQLA